jgi:hypothetical protein
MDTLSITEPEQRLEATLDNLIPFTNYSVTLWASTSAGIGVGPVVILTTRESGTTSSACSRDHPLTNSFCSP